MNEYFNYQQYFDTAVDFFMTSGIRILFIIIITIIILKLSAFVTKKIFAKILTSKKDSEFSKRTETLYSIIKYIINTIAIIIAVLMLLSELKIDIGPILAAAGVLGLAVGFGAQSLVKDFLSGFFILLENQIRVGDVVQISGRAGYVEQMNLRFVRLRDLEGKVHFVPNGTIDVVTNFTKEFSYYVFDIPVAYRENVDEVLNVMQQVEKSLREDADFKGDILEPMEFFGLDKFDDSALIIKSRIKTQPIKQWRIAREFNKRLKQKFDQQGIEIPFPHLTLYIGKDKNNQSPPLSLLLNNK
jgi:small-conductance mechanosensitive channel